jgi:integrase
MTSTSEQETVETTTTTSAPVSVNNLIGWYIHKFEGVMSWGRTKAEHLRFLQKQRFSEHDALTLTSGVAHVRQRRRDGASASVISADLRLLGVVLRAAKSAHVCAVGAEPVIQALARSQNLQLIGRSGEKRQRRVTAQETELLDEYFGSRRRLGIPMRDIVSFALHSAREEAEICRLAWADVDEHDHTCLLRDQMRSERIHVTPRRFKFTDEAWDIVQRQNRNHEYIFPYSPQSIGQAFRRACRDVGIADLHFQDLRHEATIRLFECGYTIYEVAYITLNWSMSDLKRYASAHVARRHRPITPTIRKRP